MASSIKSKSVVLSTCLILISFGPLAVLAQSTPTATAFVQAYRPSLYDSDGVRYCDFRVSLGNDCKLADDYVAIYKASFTFCVLDVVLCVSLVFYRLVVRRLPLFAQNHLIAFDGLTIFCGIFALIEGILAYLLWNPLGYDYIGTPYVVREVVHLLPWPLLIFGTLNLNTSLAFAIPRHYIHQAASFKKTNMPSQQQSFFIVYAYMGIWFLLLIPAALIGYYHEQNDPTTEQLVYQFTYNFAAFLALVLSFVASYVTFQFMTLIQVTLNSSIGVLSSPANSQQKKRDLFLKTELFKIRVVTYSTNFIAFFEAVIVFLEANFYGYYTINGVSQLMLVLHTLIATFAILLIISGFVVLEIKAYCVRDTHESDHDKNNNSDKVGDSNEHKKVETLIILTSENEHDPNAVDLQGPVDA